MTDLSSVLPTMPTYFGAQFPVAPPAAAPSPFMDALRQVTAVRPAAPQNSISMVPPSPPAPASTQSYFGAALPAMSPAPARPMAPAPPAAPASSLFTPPPRPPDTIAPPVLGGEPAQSGGYIPPAPRAAPNVIQGGIPAPLPPHPADYATWYAGKLAENMQAGAEAGPGGGQGIHFVGPNSPPPMESASPAAINVIRGGVPGAEGNGGGGGINAIQLQTLMPLLQGQQAARLSPASVAQHALITHTEREQAVNTALADALARHDKTAEASARNALATMQTDSYKQYIGRMRLLGFGLPGIEAGQAAQNLPTF